MTSEDSCGNDVTACSMCSTQFIETPCSPPPRGNYPKGRLHQSRVIDVIDHILEMKESAFTAFCNHNGFKLVVLNYQYLVEELTGKRTRCPVDVPTLAPIYFRMTQEVCNQLRMNTKPSEKLNGTHQEHAVPVAMVVRELIALRKRGGWTWIEIENIVRTSEIILVTSEQEQLLDGKAGRILNGQPCLNLKSTMPEVNGRPWKFGDCHLARICKITKTIVGKRML